MGGRSSTFALFRHEGLPPAGHRWRPPPLLLPDSAVESSTNALEPTVVDLPDSLDRGYDEEVHLKNVRQLTYGGDNAEAYWSFDGKDLVLSLKPQLGVGRPDLRHGHQTARRPKRPRHRSARDWAAPPAPTSCRGQHRRVRLDPCGGHRLPRVRAAAQGRIRLAHLPDLRHLHHERRRRGHPVHRR